MYGFVFQIFWLAGALRLNSRLRVPDHWESWKTEAERQELIQVVMTDGGQVGEALHPCARGSCCRDPRGRTRCHLRVEALSRSLWRSLPFSIISILCSPSRAYSASACNSLPVIAANDLRYPCLTTFIHELAPHSF